MIDPIFDEEYEFLEAVGRGQLWGAAICVVLSILSCGLWIGMLFWPHVSH
ncbi:hypothetical protein B1R32_10837 [Abditibacterium utsteinense]|uniref:Uncharacterized protein n=1 Tax=Abditibacterium utsteinense TaxID=1960156 RepID=A0A2S8SSP5_9BACT|nr:hypothetical protein [Abditibacterium utsteinense]PQV63833.1 hypothetical protein B1R32_10837 [Abditibacterium utsteinense]